MRADSCRALTTLALLCLCTAALTPGCFLLHERDGLAIDTPDAAAPRDSSPPVVEASILPCRPVQGAALACAGHDAVAGLEVGRPTALEVRVDDCHCGGSLQCFADEVTLASASAEGSIAVTIQVCGEGRCRACTEPSEVSCALPALSAGVYRVSINGEATFSLPAVDGRGSDPVSYQCQTPGSRGGGMCAFPGMAAEPGADARVCAFTEAEGLVRFEVENPGTSCALEPGPCDVFATIDRSGRSVSLAPRVRDCDEGESTWGCEGSTGLLTHRCAVRLGDGDYDVLLAPGESLGTLRVSDGEVVSDPCFPARARAPRRLDTTP